MKRVFVYEYLSGGGLMGADAQAAATLMPLGLSMRNAMVSGLMPLVESRDVAVTVACGAGVDPPSGPLRMAEPNKDESPFSFVARQAAAHDLVWLVAPETMGLLAEMATLVGSRKWLGCHVEAIHVASDKRATAAVLGEQGVLTPQNFKHDPQTCQWVVKPNDGAGAVGTVVHDSLDSAQADQAQRRLSGEDPLLEPWVPGEAMSLSLLCSAHGASIVSVNRQHIEIDARGVLAFRGVSPLPQTEQQAITGALAPLAERLMAAIPGLRGFVGVDLVWHADKGAVVIEVNPRITCAYVGLPASQGRELAAEVIGAHMVEHGHGA